MKKLTKLRLALVFTAGLFAAISADNTAFAVEDHSPYPLEGYTYVRHHWYEANDSLAFAEDFHFKASVGEVWVSILDWRVTIEDWDHWPAHSCNSIDGVQNSEQYIEVDAWNCEVPLGRYIEITVEFWLDDENDIHISSDYWTDEESPGAEYGGLPDYGWAVTDEASQKIVTIYNDETAGGDSFKVTDFEHHISTWCFTDLKHVPYGNPDPGTYLLAPGETVSFAIPSVDTVGHLYFHFAMLDPQDEVLSQMYGDHGIGATMPMLPMFTEWGLIVLVTFLIVTAIFIMLRRKKGVARA
jgi:hypothetical protein